MDPNNLTAAFGVWAAVVGLVGAALVYELSRLRNEIKAIAERLNNSVVEFEHRLTAVESCILRCPAYHGHNTPAK
jgi:hypothetical protein